MPVPLSDPPLVPDDFVVDEWVFLAAFFEDFALFFEPVVEPDSSPDALEPDMALSEPEDPDEPLALDFLAVAFLWCLAWCFEDFAPLSLPIVAGLRSLAADGGAPCEFCPS